MVVCFVIRVLPDSKPLTGSRIHGPADDLQSCPKADGEESDDGTWRSTRHGEGSR